MKDPYEKDGKYYWVNAAADALIYFHRVGINIEDVIEDTVEGLSPRLNGFVSKKTTREVKIQAQENFMHRINREVFEKGIDLSQESLDGLSDQGNLLLEVMYLYLFEQASGSNYKSFLHFLGNHKEATYNDHAKRS